MGMALEKGIEEIQDWTMKYARSWMGSKVCIYPLCSLRLCECFTFCSFPILRPFFLLFPHLNFGSVYGYRDLFTSHGCSSSKAKHCGKFPLLRENSILCRHDVVWSPGCSFQGDAKKRGTNTATNGIHRAAIRIVRLPMREHSVWLSTKGCVAELL